MRFDLVGDHVGKEELAELSQRLQNIARDVGNLSHNEPGFLMRLQALHKQAGCGCFTIALMTARRCCYRALRCTTMVNRGFKTDKQRTLELRSTLFTWARLERRESLR